MVQAAGELRFPRKPLAQILAVGQLRREHLDRDVALQAQVGGAVHHAHAAASDLGAQLVVGSQCLD